MKTAILNSLSFGLLAILAVACSESSIHSKTQPEDGLKGSTQEKSLNRTRATFGEAKQTQADYSIQKEKDELQKRYDLLESNYLALQSKHEADQSKFEQSSLRNRLFGEGVVGKDLKFGFVNGSNVKSVYEKFVNGVSDNRNTYSREDWDEIKVLYEALDNRKNVIEPQIKTKDNLDIARLKIRFTAIKAWNRPGTKVDENQLAKAEP